MSGDGTAGPATRRRGAALERAILRAALDELADVGYPRLTMERVATRAGTSKNAIYRRWPDRAALAVAAYRQLLADGTPQTVPDTGALRSDALALLRRVNARMSAPSGAILRELLAGIRDDPDGIRAVREQLVRASVDPWLTILARAARRGEVRSDTLTLRVVTVALDLLRNEYGMNGVTEVPDHVLVEIVDQVFLPLVRNG